MYTLYIVEGEHRSRQNLKPVISEKDSPLLKQLFELLKQDIVLTVVSDADNLLMSFTLRSVSHDRKYITELIAEITGNIKFSI